MRHSARSPSRNGAPSRMLCARRYAGSSRSTLHTGASRRPSGSRWVDGGNFQFYEVVRDVALEITAATSQPCPSPEWRPTRLAKSCALGTGQHAKRLLGGWSASGGRHPRAIGPPTESVLVPGWLLAGSKDSGECGTLVGGGCARYATQGGRVLNPNDLRRYRETIAKSVVFEQLEPDDVDLILSSCRLLDTAAGGFILTEGVPSDGLYIILEGQIEFSSPRTCGW